VLAARNAGDQFDVLGLPAAAFMDQPADWITDTPIAMAGDRQVDFFR
jgi:hypothetical protein